MVRAGLQSIYLSGWQVAADANVAGHTYPDQSLYPMNSAPLLVQQAMHWQAFFLLPALYGPGASIHVRRDFFPGLETVFSRSVARTVLPTLRVLPASRGL